VRAVRAVGAAFERQRGALFPWVPVVLGLGIGWYFLLWQEPSVGLLQAAGLGAAALVLAALMLPPDWRVLPLVPALLLAGLALAGWRAHQVAAPVLGFRYYGPIEGRVVEIDRSASDAVRLTLDRVVLARMDPDRVPARVRVSLHSDAEVLEPEPGMRVMLTGNLSPPEGPVAPRGYDFRRQAWFEGLGAVGYSRLPLMLLEPAVPGPALWFARLKMRLAGAIRAGLPGQAGAFAATVMTGDRSGLTKDTSDDLRGANLSHLLAISGLHMVLVCGTVFGALRLLLVLVPWLGLRVPARKIAAAAALLAGLFYYLLSGREIPAERAWIMVAVVFGAVMLDRRAISLRSVAVAALVVMVLRPEAMVQPGFQMSFAATVALVSAFNGMRRWQGWRPPRWALPAVTVLFSSAVAGAATAPFAAAHFNRIADYGLVANLLSVPLMGAAVMPLAVAWAVLEPLGLGEAVLWLMGWPVRWILGVADRVSGLDGAVTLVTAPGPEVVPLLALGGLMLCLWQGRGRLAGLAPLALALALWSVTGRPDLLIAGEGALLGRIGPEGRALSKPKGDGFAAASWLEDDGDGALQEEAALRPGLERGPGEVALTLAGLRLRQFSGRGGAERAAAACGSAEIVMLTTAAPEAADCLIWDAALMRRTGPVAIWETPDGARIETVAGTAGQRLWTGQTGEVPDLIRAPAQVAGR
jgi:competence protein ComEC